MQPGDIIKTKYATFGVIRGFLLDSLTYEVLTFGGMFPGTISFMRADEMELIEPEHLPEHLAIPILGSLLNVVRLIRANQLPF